MTTISESTQAAGAGMGAGLQAAVAQLSDGQTFTFSLYKRLVLPLDGYVFYVLASKLNSDFLALYNASAFNRNPMNAQRVVLTPAQLQRLTFQVQGSLHLSQTTEQEAESSVSRQNAMFTTKTKVVDFAELAPDECYIMTLPNGYRLAFNSQANRYQFADLWHYAGRALLPYESTQVVDDPQSLDVENAIVSNSMPLWIAMSTVSVPIFPAFLSSSNMVPPYITADISNTQGIGQSPVYDATSGQTQLTQENVKFTLWGMRNDAALDFQTALLQNSLDGSYGVMNIPVPVDEKKTQSEFNIIAQKKTMELQVNYYQAQVREVTRKLITSAFITITEG